MYSGADIRDYPLQESDKRQREKQILLQHERLRERGLSLLFIPSRCFANRILL